MDARWLSNLVGETELTRFGISVIFRRCNQAFSAPPTPPMFAFTVPLNLARNVNKIRLSKLAEVAGTI